MDNGPILLSSLATHDVDPGDSRLSMVSLVVTSGLVLH